MTRYFLLLCGVCLAFLGNGAAAKEFFLVFGHTGEVVPVSTKGVTEFQQFSEPTETHSAHGITYNLYYVDIRDGLNIGFDGPNGTMARDRVRDTLTVIADTLNESGTLDILFRESLTTLPGPLASAGTYYIVEPSFQSGIAFERLMTGFKASSALEEINVQVNFGHNYNFTTAPTLIPQTDLMTVLLHEFGHGLGIASVALSDGSSAVMNQAQTISAFTHWNARIALGQGGSPLWAGDPPAFQGTAANLTGQNLTFTGTQAINLFPGSGRPPIHAPATFSSGSSLSHWGVGIGAVMEPFLAQGIDRRTFSSTDLGGLIDIGYTNAAAPTPPVPVLPQAVITGRAQIEVGQTLILGISIQGATITDYQWYKDGLLLNDETGSVLQITDVTFADAGVYQAELVGSLDKSATGTTLPHTVTVYPAGALPLGGGLLVLAAAFALLGCAAMARPATRRPSTR